MLGGNFEGVLSAARRGDERALTAIYRDLDPALLTYLGSRHPSRAEDIASETWLHVATGLARFEGDEEHFRAWVFTIARRRLIEELRRDARRPTAPLGDSQETIVGGDVEHEAMDRISSEEALARIRSLPPAQAEVVLLRVIADLPVKQVAGIIGKREAAVRALQHRALKRLAKRTSQRAVTP